MKHLTREEMKKVLGGGPCGAYEGQTIYVCGSRINGSNCYADFCSCGDYAPIPQGCDVQVECSYLENQP